MRLLHINHRYAPYSGGSEVVIQRISEAFARDGHDVTVVTSDAFDLEYFWDRRRRKIDAPPTEDLGGVRVIRVPVRHLPASPIVFQGSRRLMGELSRVLRPACPFEYVSRIQPWIPGLRDAMRSAGQVDVVLATNLGLESLAVVAHEHARRIGAAFALMPFLHLGPDDSPVARRYVTMPHQLKLLRDADVVMTMTEREREFITGLGVPPGRVVVTGAGVDVDAVTGGDGVGFRNRHQLDGFVVGSLGPPSAEKGTPDLVRAIASLRRAGRDVSLVIAGPPLSGFTRWFESLTPDERAGVRMLGYIDTAERRDLLAAIDTLALTSRTESFGIVYLEAWVNRKPVIAARAGAVPELVRDGETGLLVPYGNPDALARTIGLLMDDEGLRQSLGEHGRQLSESRYTWPDVLRRVERGYLIATERMPPLPEGAE